jgi:short-subunit dehydrogenase
LVTGASGGLGTHIARHLARQGMNLVVSGRREDALESVAEELGGLGVTVSAVPADLAEEDAIDSLAQRAEAQAGRIDVLVNNAGIELASTFTSCTREELTEIVNVNLVAPMLLTQRLLPAMLARGQGHVVFISSGAGKLGPAYNEPYAASKAGLIALTQSLRAEYRDDPVGFSVVCPGFTTGDGMYQRMLEQGFASNRMMGETTAERVAEQVMRAIRKDLPEVFETGTAVRPIFALNELAPSLVERIVSRSGVTDLYRRLALSRGRGPRAAAPR